MTVILSALGRITVPYTTDGLLHKLRVFVRNPQVVGGSYNINSRPLDNNDIVWTDALNDLCTAFSWVLGTTTAFSDGVLELRSGSIWTAVATATPSFTSHKAGTGNPGTQFTVVLRDINLKKVKIVVVEHNDNALQHAVSRSALQQTFQQNFVKEFMSDHALTNAPYVWAVGRGNQFLNTSPLVGVTASSNRRVRRRRGLT